MSERTHGCWLDLCKGQTPDRCVLETGEPVENCCVAIELRADGKTQWACEYWKPLNPEHPSEVESLRAEIARLRLTDEERDLLDALCRSGYLLPHGVKIIDGLLARLGGEK